ncbi:hypothetical protein TNCV_2651561 [Trichonephila clavipes]|nr:hypothetical protein TNCV_2651561 [Trichonephila clavipes]
MLVESEQRFGRPQTIRNLAVVEKPENLKMKDRCLTVLEIAEQVEISTGSTQTILCDHSHRAGMKFVLSFCRWNSKDFVLQLHRTYWTLSTMNLSLFDFWLFPKMKMS